MVCISLTLHIDGILSLYHWSLQMSDHISCVLRIRYLLLFVKSIKFDVCHGKREHCLYVYWLNICLNDLFIIKHHQFTYWTVQNTLINISICGKRMENWELIVEPISKTQNAFPPSNFQLKLENQLKDFSHFFYLHGNAFQRLSRKA